MSKYLFDLLFNENNPHGFHASVSRWSTSLILLNLVAMVLETGEGFAASYAAELDLFETFSVIVFISVMALRIAQKERVIYLSEKILHRLTRAG